MEKKGVGRPRDGNPEETRRQILDAAAGAFSESGFVGATTRTVASRAGVNVATLHYHFGSKEGLYRAVLAHASHGILPEPPAASGAGAVAALVDDLFAFGAEHPALARLALLDVLAGPGGSTPDARVRWLADALRAPLATDSGEPAAAEKAARAIVAFVDAAFVAAAPRNGKRAADPADAADAANAAEAAAPESPAPALPDVAAREAVVAAALRLTRPG